MGYLAEVELTQTTEAGGSRARAEKEPEEPIVDLWTRMSEIGRKGRMGSRVGEGRRLNSGKWIC